jgi:hypothetical protein
MAKSDTLRYIKNAKEMGTSRLGRWRDLESARIHEARVLEAKQLATHIKAKILAPAAAITKVLLANGVTQPTYNHGAKFVMTPEAVAEHITAGWAIGSISSKAEEKDRKELLARYDELCEELYIIAMRAEQAVLLTGVGEELKAALKEMDTFLAKIR